MASIDPELRMRQLARLRAAYDAGPSLGDDPIRNSTVRHSRVLLGRILMTLTDSLSGAGAPENRSDDKACADV